MGLIPVWTIHLRAGPHDSSGLPPQTILWNILPYNYFSKTFLSSWFCLFFPPLFQYFFNIENKRRLREFFAKNTNFALKACRGEFPRSIIYMIMCQLSKHEKLFLVQLSSLVLGSLFPQPAFQAGCYFFWTTWFSSPPYPALEDEQNKCSTLLHMLIPLLLFLLGMRRLTMSQVLVLCEIFSLFFTKKTATLDYIDPYFAVSLLL